MASFYTVSYRSRCIFLMMFIKTINSSNITNISITEDADKLYCIITNDDTNTAITWDATDVKYSSNSHEHIKINLEKFKMAELQNSLQNNFGPILDYRWEHLPLYNFFQAISLEEINQISISIQKGNNFCICQNILKNGCYKIYLKKKCDIHQEENFNDKLCSAENKSRVQKTWEHFTITLESDRYMIEQYGCRNSHLLNISYSPYRYLITNGKWKLHDVPVYSIKSNDIMEIIVQNRSTNFANSCYGLLVKVPINSTLTLELCNVVECFVSKANKKIDEWEEIKLCTFASSNTTMKLFIKPTIRNSTVPVLTAETLRHYEHDIRIATLTKTKNSHCCYDLKFGNKVCSNQLTTYNLVARNHTCPSATIGIYCIPCREIFGQDNCGNHSICELTRSHKTICSCPNGTEETNCTAPFIPPKPIIVYSVSNENVKLRFEPDLLKGLAENYEAWWSDNNHVGMVCEHAIPCKIWTGQICIECKNLLPNKSIKFQVKTLGDNESQYDKFQEVTAKAEEKGPSQPKNITYFWDDVTNALTLKWNHPDIPNGPITMFSFYISGIEIETYNVKEEQYEYAHTIEFQKLNVSWSNDVTITVSAHNQNGINTTNCQIFTPPKQPELFKNPIFINRFDKSFVIQVVLQILSIDDTYSYMYVILTNTERLIESSYLMESQEKLFKCGNIQDRGNSWIVEKISLNTFRNDSIDINATSCISTEENKLKPECKVLILLENEYNGISRCKTYSVDGIMGINYNKLLFLLVSPIIGIIAIIVYKLIKPMSGCLYSNETSSRSRKVTSNQSQLMPELMHDEHVYNEPTIYDEIALINQTLKESQVPPEPVYDYAYQKRLPDNKMVQNNQTLKESQSTPEFEYDYPYQKRITGNSMNQINQILKNNQLTSEPVYEERISDSDIAQINQTLPVLAEYEQIPIPIPKFPDRNEIIKKRYITLDELKN